MFNHNNVSSHVIGNLVNGTVADFQMMARENKDFILENHDGRLVVDGPFVGKVQNEELVSINEDETVFIQALLDARLINSLKDCCRKDTVYGLKMMPYESLKEMGFDMGAENVTSLKLEETLEWVSDEELIAQEVEEEVKMNQKREIDPEIVEKALRDKAELDGKFRKVIYGATAAFAAAMLFVIVKK